MEKPRKETDGIVKTTVRLPRPLWDRAKIRAIKERCPVQDLLLRALEAYLKGGGR